MKRMDDSKCENRGMLLIPSVTVKEGQKVIICDPETGELAEHIPTIIPEGTKFSTPYQQERNRRYYEMRDRKDIKRDKESTQFTLMRVIGDYGVSPESFVRLVYLSTYIKFYDTLLIRGSHPIEFDSLPMILNVSDSTARRFWNEVNQKYLWVDEMSHIHMNDNVWYRGQLKDYKQTTKLYRNAIRNLYQNAPTSSHKRIGAIFRLLPYLNIKSNALCAEPFTMSMEKNPDNIEYMTVRQLGDLLGVGRSMDDDSNVNRLIQELRKYQFTVDEQEQNLIAFCFDDKPIDSRIYINPNIVYSGTPAGKARIMELASFMRRKKGE